MALRLNGSPIPPHPKSPNHSRMGELPRAKMKKPASGEPFSPNAGRNYKWIVAILKN
jgi:hypothetical protein